ncbi:MAG: acyl carrier protein [Rhodospirillales bacterium]
MSSVKDAILEEISEVCFPNTPEITDPDDSLLNQGIDSLDLATVLMALEERFEIEIPEDEIKELASLNNVIAIIEARIS